MSARSLGLVPILLFAGCQPDASVREVSGLRGFGEADTVFSPEPLWAEGEGWSVRSEPRMTIGTIDGDEDHQFSTITAAARQADGDIVVTDAGSRTARLYDDLGRIKRRLGGPGAGPGEFQRPTQILLVRDSILVWDDTAWRLSRFDPEGELVDVRAVRVDEISKAVDPPLYPSHARMRDRHSLVVRLVTKSKDAPLDGPYRNPSGALIVSLEDGTIEALMDFDDAEQAVVDSPWGPISVSPPLATTTTLSGRAERGRLCAGDQARPEVVCFGQAESPIVMTWLSESRALSAEDPELLTWRDDTEELYGQKLSGDDLRRLIARVPVPHLRPPHSGISVGDEGDVWVRLGPTAGPARSGTDHLVFSSGGALLGTVSVPVSRLLEIGKDHALGVRIDEFGVEYLWLMELDRSARSGAAIDLGEGDREGADTDRDG